MVPCYKPGFVSVFLFTGHIVMGSEAAGHPIYKQRA